MFPQNFPGIFMLCPFAQCACRNCFCSLFSDGRKNIAANFKCNLLHFKGLHPPRPLRISGQDLCPVFIVCFASADTYYEEEHSNEVETHDWHKFATSAFSFFCARFSFQIFSFYYMIAISFCRACFAW